MTNQKKLKSVCSTISIFGKDSKVFKKQKKVFFNTCFEKNTLKALIAWFLDQYGEKKTVDLVETLKQVGFHQATLAGVSLGVDDLQIPPQKATRLSQASVNMTTLTQALQAGNVTSVEKSQRLIDTWNQTSETLRQAAVHNFRSTNPVNPVYMMAFSGARGNISQVRQLVAMRGLMADPQGAILEFPIQSNFREGLTVTEYLISCYGARKGLVDTALRTATSGYLTRRLVDAVQHVVVYVTDCQTQKGILIKDKNLEQRLVGRVLLEDVILTSTTSIPKNTLISARLAKSIVAHHTQVRVRSPLTCQTEKSVCQLCYGLDLGRGKLVSLGEAVGIIAAQSIGEPGTQLTMRTFHTGGVGVFSEQALKPFTAPFDGKVEFFNPLPGLFVRTPHGNIVYLVKHKLSEDEKNKPFLRLIPSPFSKNLVGPEKTFFGKGMSTLEKNIVYEIMYNQVPAGSLIWIKQGEMVKAGQLLIQASCLETTTQEMPESSHPVQAPFSGEVVFDYMATRLIEEVSFQKLQLQHKQEKSGKQKEWDIGPLFPTLTELGRLWVLSSCVQTESQVSKSFFFKGDLLSRETPLQQYNLHVPYKGQLKQSNSSLVLGYTASKLPFAKSQYSGGGYCFLTSIEPHNSSVLAYTKTLTQTRLTWYPYFKTGLVSFSGYYYVLSEESSEKINPSATTEPMELRTSSILSPHDLFQLKLIVKSNSVSKALAYQTRLFPTSGFVLAQEIETLSKTGVFQIQSGLPKRLFGSGSPGCQKTRFQPNFGQNPLALQNQLGDEQNSEFLKKALNRAHRVIFVDSRPQLIQKKGAWFYIPQTSFSQTVTSQMPGILLQPGKQFEKFRFDHSYISANLLHRKDIVVLKSTHKKNQSSLFYSTQDYINVKKKFSTDLVPFPFPKTQFLGPNVFSTQKENFWVRPTAFLGKKNSLITATSRGIGRAFNRQKTSEFCFFKKQASSYLYELNFFVKRKRQVSHLLLLQKNLYQLFPERQVVKRQWLQNNKEAFPFSVRSPLFTKQNKTQLELVENSPSGVHKILPVGSGWFGRSQFVKVDLQFRTLKGWEKDDHLSKKFHLVPKTRFLEKDQLSFSKDNGVNPSRSSEHCVLIIPGFSVGFFRKLTLQQADKYSFQTFSGGWVLPEFTITPAFVKSKDLGEFRGSQKKREGVSPRGLGTSLNVLRNQDLITLQRPSHKLVCGKKSGDWYVQVGDRVRWGEELVAGFASPVSGQVLKITPTNVTLRKGLPLLASIRGLVHVHTQDFVEKNELLITLKSRRLQTEDIVQGIPKIEQLFEARETQGGEIIQNNMHALLQSFFTRASQVRQNQEAVQLSLTYIQKFLVENILAAYSNQGVHIAEKHVEIVVRQMTARVRITQGGDSGLLPGELIQLRVLEKVNSGLTRLGRRAAQYEPIILGITKSVLQSESFLLAASFQQVSKVLVRSALAKKTDFLRGLHENILVGQPIPAGTGIIDLPSLSHKLVCGTNQGFGKESQELNSTDKNAVVLPKSLYGDSLEKNSL